MQYPLPSPAESKPSATEAREAFGSTLPGPLSLEIPVVVCLAYNVHLNASSAKTEERVVILRASRTSTAEKDFYDQLGFVCARFAKIRRFPTKHDLVGITSHPFVFKGRLKSEFSHESLKKA